MVTTFSHGVSGYTNHGCRCNECRTSWRHKARQRRNSQPSPLATQVELLTAQVDHLQRQNDDLRRQLNDEYQKVTP